MFLKGLSRALLLPLCLPAFASGAVPRQDPGEAERVAKVKAAVDKLGVGSKAKV